LTLTPVGAGEFGPLGGAVVQVFRRGLAVPAGFILGLGPPRIEIADDGEHRDARYDSNSAISVHRRSPRFKAAGSVDTMCWITRTRRPSSDIPTDRLGDIKTRKKGQISKVWEKSRSPDRMDVRRRVRYDSRPEHRPPRSRRNPRAPKDRVEAA